MDNNRVIKFTKMHGIGNDYIYIYCPADYPEMLPDLAVAMSDRHKGVGGDGIILISPSKNADFRMRIFNADGSEARMCGNGIRCVAKYVYDHGLTPKRLITVDTLSGVKHLALDVDSSGKVSDVTVDMGIPVIDAGDIPVKCSGRNMINEPVATAADGTLFITAVSMGNPHGVIFVNNLDEINFEVTGPELECHEMWPDRANIEFAEVISQNEILMRVWERGSGETMACGTGACATAVAAMLLGLCERKVTIHLRGGDLSVEWGDDSHVYMRGSATTVFDGTYYI